MWLDNYRRRARKLESSGTSILLSYYTENVEIIPLKTGVIGDMHYSAIAAAPKALDQRESVAALLYRVELPFHSRVHLLGIPKQNGAIQLVPAGGKSLMEQVVLEGDYNNYFSLYAEKDMQLQSRYVMDPKAMVFTVDFCQSHNWEILGGELYFVQTNANVAGDTTTMFEDIGTFVNEIRPAIEVPLTAEELRIRTPFKQVRRTDLKCPICSGLLDPQQSFLSCPGGHGFLLQGGALAQVSNGEIILPTVISEARNTKGEIICPSCGRKMIETAYNGGKTLIDSCPNCPYRWLDMGELSRSHET